jgi:hypothetical protein
MKSNSSPGKELDDVEEAAERPGDRMDDEGDFNRCDEDDEVDERCGERGATAEEEEDLDGVE